MEHYEAFVYQENLLKIERKLVSPPAFELFDKILMIFEKLRAA
jgi:hypothetical protein